MDIKKISSSSTPNFFSKEMVITKKSLHENKFKYPYQNKTVNLRSRL